MKNVKIYKNVTIGKNTEIGDFVIIGVPPRDKKNGDLKTVIGNNAIIRSHSVIYAGNVIGNNFQTGHSVNIREENKIGDNVSIGTHSVIEHHLIIEDGVRIHSNVFVPEYSTLKKECWLGPNVVLTNALHPKCPRVKECLKGPTIEQKAVIGANATLLPDITIGKKCLIGAGSVVTSDCKDNSVYIGNPAKYIMKIKDIKCRYGLMKKPYEVNDE
jgi:acetyltransferase-like isoleucine patch superfamily enzyme